MRVLIYNIYRSLDPGEYAANMVPGTVTAWPRSCNNRVAISQRFIIINRNVPESYSRCAEIL